MKALPNVSHVNASECDKSGERTWCSCDQVEFVKMVECDNDGYRIQWFHYACVGMTCAPRGKWYCPECRKLPQFRSKRK